MLQFNAERARNRTSWLFLLSFSGFDAICPPSNAKQRAGKHLAVQMVRHFSNARYNLAAAALQPRIF